MSCSRGCCATQADHYRSVVVRPLSTAEGRRETALSKDMDAYRRLRSVGAQPTHISGSADLEKTAGSAWEVEAGYGIRNDRFRKDLLGRLEEAAPVSITPDDAA